MILNDVIIQNEKKEERTKNMFFLHKSTNLKANFIEINIYWSFWLVLWDRRVATYFFVYAIFLWLAKTKGKSYKTYIKCLFLRLDMSI
jgi:hypothetical protein